ncbi:MAG: DUF3089 domain-containing protein [Microthrixaceae bacterium]
MGPDPRTQPVPRLGLAITVAVLIAVGCSPAKSGSATGPRSTAPRERSSTTSATGGRPLARYRDYRTVNYSEDSHWLCRPGRRDICASDLDTTRIDADGTMTVHRFRDVANPPVDCFYVYPTISKDPGPRSDWHASDGEEGLAALNQVARLRGRCRIFAPVYRQTTLAGLTQALAGLPDSSSAGPSTTTPDDGSEPYDDVLDAWRSYMATDNDGRGVVLIGHSQGSAILSRLLREEIDPHPDVRAQLVSAYLAGWGVAVPDGRTVGAAFQHIAACTRVEEAGCVLSWSSFRADSPPPPNALFGIPRDGTAGVAVCVNPAAPDGDGVTGPDSTPHSVFPAVRSQSILMGAATGSGRADTPPTTEAPTVDNAWIDPAVGVVTTPFVEVPGLVTARCTRHDGFDYLAVSAHGTPGPRADDIVGDLGPQWGLHLLDVNLVMGDIVDLVGHQSTVWLDG